MLSASSAAKKWSLDLSSTLNSNLYKKKSVDHSMGSSFDASFGYDFSSFNSNLSLSASKDLQGLREFTLQDGALSFSKELQTYYNFSFSTKMALTIPLSEASQKNNRLYTALGISPSLTYTNKDLSISLTPSVLVQFHELKTAKLGTPNTQYALGASLGLSYQFTDVISAFLTGALKKSITYNGFKKDNYSTSQGLVLSFGKLYYVFSHSIGKALLNTRGNNINIDLFDSRNSIVGFSVGHTF